MKVKELISLLEKIEDKEKNVSLSTKGVYYTTTESSETVEESQNLVVIRSKLYNEFVGK